MKKYLAFLLVAIMVLAACNGDDQVEEPEENEEETEETEGEENGSEEDEEAASEGSVEDIGLEAVRTYSEVIGDIYEPGAEADFGSVEEVADYLVENAPISENQANEIAGLAYDEDGTWAELDHALTLEEDDASSFDTVELMEGNIQISKTISGDVEENRGHYVYNVRDVDGEWLFDNFHFGYLDGEHPDDQEEEEEEEEE
ncbi:hypothetical protein [Alkalibacillus haloalkaliphilus]|uniref:Lipoprotein n=1 Tax=Alkalibacillus haloalkaliphilus TaxID=94136 RepID=A0A511W5I7_9BACI|nr:hypothetical protein [Alkalibacillus haloalkaliphilus]GEN46369.1 hypothetical protein AHA02nite_21450 [Alkalibacillus haloalkaliphilus]